jgi:hypothetical protein
VGNRLGVDVSVGTVWRNQVGVDVGVGNQLGVDVGVGNQLGVDVDVRGCGEPVRG